MKKKTVTVRNITLGEGRPAIAIPLVAGNRAEMKEALNKCRETQADLVEYRADYDPEVMAGGAALEDRLRTIRETLGDMPLLFTIRTKAEGGEADIPFETYASLNERAASSGYVDLVDVELLSAGEKAKAHVQKLQSLGVKVIGSSHDFHATPSDEEMVHRIEAMQEAGMDITKLAVMPQNKEDVLRLLAVTVKIDQEIADRPCVTMSMGRMGVISRVTGSFTGSAITFGAAGKASAPGQIAADDLMQILHILA